MQEGADTAAKLFSNKFSGRPVYYSYPPRAYACILLPWKWQPFWCTASIVFTLHQNGRHGSCQAVAMLLHHMQMLYCSY